MTGAEFARLVVEVCALSLPSGITTDRLRAFAEVESGQTALVLNINGPGGGPRRFRSEADAIAAAHALDAQGRDFDAGILQINRRNWSRVGLTAETVFKPCPNIAAGIVILADADRRAACEWNTGRQNCRRPNGTNGYPEKIQAAAARLAREAGEAPSPAPAAAPQPDPDAPPAWDVWAKPRPRRVTKKPAGESEAPPPVVLSASRSGADQ